MSFGGSRCFDRRDFLRLSGAGLAGAVILGLAGTGAWARTPPSVVREAEEAEERFGVPAELLLAIGYENAALEMPSPEAGEYDPKSPHGMGGYGTMDLHKDPTSDTLVRAASLARLSEVSLKTDRRSNILGGAAVIAEAAGHPGPGDLNAYFDAVAEVWSGPRFANDVYQTLNEGFSTRLRSGERATLAPQPEAETRALAMSMAAGQYPGSTWEGAHADNHTVSDREGAYDINKIVVHIGEGGYRKILDWFKDARSRGSAHYTVGRAGEVGQSVLEKDVAWHAGWWSYNTSSVGIEHEGYTGVGGFTDTMYRSSASLAAYLCKKYEIPVDRAHIVGHDEVPGCDGSGGGADCHTDPGRYWDWTKYMDLVRSYAGSSSPVTPAPTTTPVASSTYGMVVDNKTAGRFFASSNWKPGSFNSQRYGADFRYVTPKAVSDPATFKVKIPTTGQYDVFAWWPSHSSYNGAAPIKIQTTGGAKWLKLDQRVSGGRWVYLGAFGLGAGDGGYIQVSRWTSSSGPIFADAVKVVRR